MSTHSFICPYCRQDCATPYDLLTCHPRYLRACTDALIDKDGSKYLLPLVQGHTMPVRVLVAVAERLMEVGA